MPTSTPPTHPIELTAIFAWLSVVGIKILQIVGILFLCWVLIRFINRLTRKFYLSQVQKQRLALTERKAQTLNSITNSVMKYVVYFIGIFTILKQLGVNDSSLVVVASAGSVAIGLGAQSIVTDMIEGFFILFEDYYAVGDIVTIQGLTGVVEGVTLRSTKIRDPEGSVHIIPNGSVGTVSNLCVDFMNAIVTIGVAYGENIDHVLSVLEDEMTHTSDMETIIQTPEVVGIVSLDDNAVTIKIVAKCKVKTHFAVGTELRRRIKNRLDKEGIEIPFPQRTIRIINE